MRVRTTPASGQTQIALTEPVPLTFVDLRPAERNKVILGRCTDAANGLLRIGTPDLGARDSP